MLLMLPGLMAPFLISVVMIWTSKNSKLQEDFVNRLVNPRLIRLKMLPAFLFIMPLSILVSIAISLLFGESISQFQLAEGFSFSSGFVPVLLLLLLAATFEEFGWRVYAFDSLQSRYNYLTASIIFSLLWQTPSHIHRILASTEKPEAGLYCATLKLITPPEYVMTSPPPCRAKTVAVERALTYSSKKEPSPQKARVQPSAGPIVMALPFVS